MKRVREEISQRRSCSIIGGRRQASVPRRKGPTYPAKTRIKTTTPVGVMPPKRQYHKPTCPRNKIRSRYDAWLRFKAGFPAGLSRFTDLPRFCLPPPLPPAPEAAAAAEAPAELPPPGLLRFPPAFIDIVIP